MKMESVRSSFISEVGHDPATNVMRVKMKSGKVYDRPNVSAERHAELMAASSVGTHWNQNFKGK